MTMRTSAETVTFLHPFHLNGVADVQPAGPYLVETDEELLPTLTAPAYRRLATFIHLAGTPRSNELSRLVDIDPAELAEALAHDARQSVIAPTPPSRPTVASHEEQRDAKDFVVGYWTHWLFSTPPS